MNSVCLAEGNEGADADETTGGIFGLSTRAGIRHTGGVKSKLLQLLVVLLSVTAAVQAFRVARNAGNWLRDQMSGHRILVEMQADRAGLAQLYWNTGKGYAETDSVTVQVRGDDRRQRLVFPVPDDPILAARFDPLRSEGSIRVWRVELQTASGSVLLVVPLESIRAGTQVDTIEMREGSLRAVFPEGANDPTLQLGSLTAADLEGRRGLPWLDALALLVLVGVLFALRKHTAGFVRAITVVRSSARVWLERLGRIDRPRTSSLLGGSIFVLLLQLWFLYPLHEVVDLPIWDEAMSMGGGVAFLDGAGLGHVVGSPLPKLIYAGLIAVFGPADAVFAQHYLVKSALTVVLFLVASRFSGSILVGLVFSGVWVISAFHLRYPILVYESGLIWFGLGLLAMSRNVVLGLALLALATLTRLEYQFAALLLVVSGLVALLQRRWKPPRLSRTGWGLAGLSVGLVLFVAFNLSGWSSGAHRGWIAVKQHFALRLWQEGTFPGYNPFLEYNLVTDPAFPTATTLGEAAGENPGALTEHVLWNLEHLPRAFMDLFAPVGAGSLPYALPITAVFLVVITGLVQLVRSPGDSFQSFRAVVRSNGLAVFGTIGGLLVAAPGVVVYAKSPYLLPVLPLALAVVALFFRLGLKRPVSGRAGALIAFVLVAGAVLSSPRPFLVSSHPRTVHATIRELDAILPEGEQAVLLGVATPTYVPYLGAHRVIAVDPLWSLDSHAVSSEEAELDRLIERHQPDLILIDSNWKGSTYFDAAGAARLPQAGWTGRPMPDGVLWVRPGN